MAPPTGRGRRVVKCHSLYTLVEDRRRSSIIRRLGTRSPYELRRAPAAASFTIHDAPISRPSAAAAAAADIYGFRASKVQRFECE